MSTVKCENEECSGGWNCGGHDVPHEENLGCTIGCYGEDELKKGGNRIWKCKPVKEVPNET
jgi:hypothetical protein